MIYIDTENIYHIRSNSSLILRRKTIFHKVVPEVPDACGQFGTAAEVS